MVIGAMISVVKYDPSSQVNFTDKRAKSAGFLHRIFPFRLLIFLNYFFLRQMLGLSCLESG
jgi:hypothetical protein